MTQLLVLDIKCDRCGTKPDRRIYPKTRAKHLNDRDDEPVSTWFCQNCGKYHIITARAFKGAA